jgi:hypothetical protein
MLLPASVIIGIFGILVGILVAVLSDYFPERQKAVERVGECLCMIGLSALIMAAAP